MTSLIGITTRRFVKISTIKENLSTINEFRALRRLHEPNEDFFENFGREHKWVAAGKQYIPDLGSTFEILDL